MPASPSTIQQLAALVAVVSVAIIGVAIMLIPPLWKGCKKTSGFPLQERRTIYKILALVYGLFVVILFITNFIGIHAPSFIQPVTRIFLIAIVVIFLFYVVVQRLISWIKKSREPYPVDYLAFSYRFTLASILLCVFFSTFALFGVSQTMLGIEIGPFNQDNYNWGRWWLADGITFFVIGILSYASIFIPQRAARPVPNYSSNRTPRALWVVFGAALCLLIGSLFAMSQQYTTRESFINNLLSMPLDVEASVSISGTQFKVVNQSDFDWKNITITLNGEELSSGYFLTLPSLKKNEAHTVDLTEFSDNAGRRFNLSTTKPLRFSIGLQNSIGQSGSRYGVLTRFP
ncbi:MAG: hypothetical protein PHU23_09140 [Dehalococcoidales bacterium]|nr:hypothetical protein [Dehalococcoidales bacterium]